METGTPNENLEQFRRIVIGDVALQQQLVHVSDRDAFLRCVVELGVAHGYRFTVADVEQALQASRRAWFEHTIVR